MCGEKHPEFRGGHRCIGSPPHVRGKACIAGELMMQGGITPACAGKRVEIVIWITSTRDHTRMCGEKPQNIRKIVLDQGSPPHVRGKAKKPP